MRDHRDQLATDNGTSYELEQGEPEDYLLTPKRSETAYGLERLITYFDRLLRHVLVR